LSRVLHGPAADSWRVVRKGCKPNSVFALASGENHLSQQPVPGTRRACARLGAGRSKVPYLALHPMGFSVPRRLRFARCALTAPFHPCSSEISNLKFEISKRRSVFCGTVRRDALRRRRPRVFRSPPTHAGGYRLRGIAPFGVRTFLPPQVTLRKAILRPSKIEVSIAGRWQSDKLNDRQLVP